MKVMLQYSINTLKDDDEYKYTKIGTHDSIMRETSDACLIEIDDEEVWFPRSVLLDDLLSGVWAANWFLEKEGLT